MKQNNQIPPHNTDAEISVLGSLMLDSKCYSLVNSYIKNADYFYNESHQNIYEAMQIMFSFGQKIDLITLAEELERHDLLKICGGAYYLSEIITKTSSAADIEIHCRIVAEKYAARELINFSKKRLQRLYEKNVDPFNEISKTENDIDKLKKELTVNQDKTLVNICDEAQDNLKQMLINRDAGKRMVGIPTGINELDSVLGGLQAKYYVCGARPSKGKSALVTSILINHTFGNEPIKAGMLSGEMQDVDIISRMAMILAKINPYKFQNLRFNNKEYNRINYWIDKIKETDLVVNSPATLKQQDLKTTIRKMVLDQGCKVIYIDHAQKIKLTNRRQPKHEGYTDISRELYSLTKELKIPIWANAQLSRSVDMRSDRKPQLSDLKESGSFEEDADVVLLIYRPEHDGFEIYPDNKTQVCKSHARLLIDKNRFGATANVPVGFINRYAWFVNENEVEYPPVFGQKQKDLFEEERTIL